MFTLPRNNVHFATDSKTKFNIKTGVQFAPEKCAFLPRFKCSLSPDFSVQFAPDYAPVTYFTDVFRKLPEYPVNQVQNLLPFNWKNGEG